MTRSLPGSFFLLWLNLTCRWVPGFLEFWLSGFLVPWFFRFCLALTGSAFLASPLAQNAISYSFGIDMTVIVAVFLEKNDDSSATNFVNAHCVSTLLIKSDCSPAPISMLTQSGPIVTAYTVSIFVIPKYCCDAITIRCPILWNLTAGSWFAQIKNGLFSQNFSFLYFTLFNLKTFFVRAKFSIPSL